MDILHFLFDFLLHIDEHLNVIIEQFGLWTYLILFLIIFCETGLVVTPFLPGDSLLFAVGALAVTTSLDVGVLIVILVLAAVIGDSVNYAIGHFLGPKAFQDPNSRIFKQEYLERTQRFYEKYGAKTIVLARFVPIVRTFAPFVAGVGKMHYLKFITYNISGGSLWVVLLVLAGYFFGNIPVIKENFEIAILAIIVLSILPGIIEIWKHKFFQSHPKGQA